MGTQQKPNTYKIRLLPDKNGEFYKKYFYHFYYTGEDKPVYLKCSKSEDLENYCPWCHASRILYQGSKEDKQKAGKYYRNTRFVGNVFVVEDPRDVQAEESYKVSGKVRLYEFPATIESKIRAQVTDQEEGRGPEIFDPEEGYNFLIKVAAKPPDQNGRIWPDYSPTEFSLKKNAIANSKEEIEEIMNSVYNLSEYLDSMSVNPETHKRLLKQEMLWEDVQDQFERYMEGKEPEKKDALNEMDNAFGSDESKDNQKGSTETEENSDTESNEDDIDDNSLLDELDKM